MDHARPTAVTRRTAGLALVAAPLAVLVTGSDTPVQAQETVPEGSLYERLGGIFAIATVVDPIEPKPHE